MWNVLLENRLIKWQLLHWNWMIYWRLKPSLSNIYKVMVIFYSIIVLLRSVYFFFKKYHWLLLFDLQSSLAFASDHYFLGNSSQLPASILNEQAMLNLINSKNVEIEVWNIQKKFCEHSFEINSVKFLVLYSNWILAGFNSVMSILKLFSKLNLNSNWNELNLCDYNLFFGTFGTLQGLSI